MGEMIGALDEKSLYAQFNLDSLAPLKRAVHVMTGYQVRPEQFDSDRGTVQLFYPGPVVRYKKFNGGHIVEIFVNGNGEGRASELVDRVNAILQHD